MGGGVDSTGFPWSSHTFLSILLPSFSLNIWFIRSDPMSVWFALHPLYLLVPVVFFFMCNPIPQLVYRESGFFSTLFSSYGCLWIIAWSECHLSTRYAREWCVDGYSRLLLSSPNILFKESRAAVFRWRVGCATWTSSIANNGKGRRLILIDLVLFSIHLTFPVLLISCQHWAHRVRSMANNTCQWQRYAHIFFASFTSIISRRLKTISLSRLLQLDIFSVCEHSSYTRAKSNRRKKMKRRFSHQHFVHIVSIQFVCCISFFYNMPCSIF